MMRKESKSGTHLGRSLLNGESSYLLGWVVRNGWN